MSQPVAVRLASRYINYRSPISIGQTGRLKPFLWFSLAVCSTAVFSSMYIGHNQIGHHRVIHDIDVQFELTCAPPEPDFKTAEQLVPINFEEGHKQAALADRHSPIQKTGVNQNAIAKIPPAVISAKTEVPPAAPEASITVANPVIPSPPANPLDRYLFNPFGASAANAATPAHASSTRQAGGAADGVERGNGPGGIGEGMGTGDANSLAGGNFGTNQLVSMQTKPTAMGNIGPYKRDVAARIKELWHPPQLQNPVVVDIALDRTGKVLASKVVNTTGDQTLDNDLINVIDKSEFKALPEWYRGNKLTIRLILRA